MNWYKFYPGDFARDTRRLTLTERGAYRELLDCYYSSEQPLPADLVTLCRMAGAHSKAERDAVKAVLEFFERDGDTLRHGRVEAEISKAGQRSETNRAIAEDRERARRGTRNEHETDNESSTNRATNRATNRTTNRETSRSTKRAPSARDQTPDTRLEDLPPSNPPSKPKPQKPPREPMPEPPDFVDAASWSAFVQMRRAGRKPFTAEAARRILLTLAQFHEQGIDANAVLDKSIRSGWADVYPPDEVTHANRSTGRSGGSHRPSLIERVDPQAGEWWDEQLRNAADSEILEPNDGGLRQQVGQPSRREADGIVVEGDFRAVG